MTDVELLAGVLGPGTREVAAALLGRFGDLHRLGRAEVDELVEVPGLGPARASRLQAALALGRRALVTPITTAGTVHDAAAAFLLLGPGLVGLLDEELHALYVDRLRRPLAHRRLTRGSDRFTVVDPRQVFRPAVRLRAAAVVLAHNHPSGDPTPSGPDREVTRRVAQAGRVLGVDLLDHLVIGDGAWVSMRERGDLTGWEPLAAAWTG